MSARVAVLVLATLAVASTVPLGADPAARSSFPWRVNATSAIARAGNTLFLSGLDLVVPRDRRGQGLIVVSAGEGAAELTDEVDSSPFAARLTAIIADGAGGWYVGGGFDAIGGVARRGVAHVFPNGRVDPAFDAKLDANALVDALALSGTTLVVGGSFTQASGTARTNLVWVSASTGALLSLAAVPSTNGRVRELAVGGTTLFVGGGFTKAGGADRGSLAAFDVTTGALLPFVADVTGLGGASVDALFVQGGALFIGGSFTAVKGVPRRNLAKVDVATAAVAAAWNPGPNDYVLDLAVDGGTVFAGGVFSTLGGLPRIGLGAVDAVTGSTTPWRADTDHVVVGLAVGAGALYATGAFRNVGGVPRLGAAAMNTTAPARVLPWNPSVGPFPMRPAVAPGRVALAGQLVGTEARDRDAVVAIDLMTGAALPWQSGFLGRRSVPEVGARYGPTLVVAGSRLVLAGQPTGGEGHVIRAFDVSTRARLPLSVSVGGLVNVLAAAGDLVYVGGAFTSVGGLARANLAAIDLRTGAVQTWAPSTDGPVFALAVDGARVVVGGEFTTVVGTNGVAMRSGLAEMTAAGAITGFNAAIARSGASLPGVNAIAIDGTRLYIGGRFDSVKGLPRQNLAALAFPTSVTPAGTLLPWRADADGPVLGVSLHRGAVFVAGDFGVVGGQPRPALARVAADTGAVHPWAPTLREGVSIAAFDDGIAAIAFGPGDASDLVHFFPEETLAGQPGVPLLPAVRVEGSTLSLQWAAPVIGPRPTSYRLEAGTAPGLSNLGTLPIGATSFAIGGVPPGAYFARLRAVGAGGVGPASEELSFVVGGAGCTMPPSTPEPPRVVVNGTGTTVRLQWTAGPGSPPIAYTLVAGTSERLGNVGAFPMGEATTLAVDNVPTGVYFARVVASNACGTSPPSGDTRITVGEALGPPESPLQLSATVTAGTVVFTWLTPPSGGAPTGHILEAGSGPGQANLASVPLPATTSFVVPGVPPGTYYVRVRALNGAGTSPPSGEVVLAVP